MKLPETTDVMIFKKIAKNGRKKWRLSLKLLLVFAKFDRNIGL
jgi:hypothetical protein